MSRAVNIEVVDKGPGPLQNAALPRLAYQPDCRAVRAPRLSVWAGPRPLSDHPSPKIASSKSRHSNFSLSTLDATATALRDAFFSLGPCAH
jgi:hypothetical protein